MAKKDSCPKCEWANIEVAYKSEKLDENNSPIADSEYLECTCTRCGYTYEDGCADKPKV